MIFIILALTFALADPPAPPAVLRDIQEIVGQWEGSGRREVGAGWDESAQGKWVFPKGAPARLMLDFAARKEPRKGLWSRFEIQADEEGSGLRLAARTVDGGMIEFRGSAKSATSMVFDRVGEEPPGTIIDRVEIRLLNEGDRLVYLAQRRLGKSQRFRPVAQAGLNRVGTSLAGANASGPKCVVTGGLGTIAVSYQGSTFYVCCTGCRDAFLENPQRYLARKEK